MEAQNDDLTLNKPFWVRNPYRSTNEFKIDSSVSLSEDEIEERLKDNEECWFYEKDYDSRNGFCPSPFSKYTLEAATKEPLSHLRAIHFYIKYQY